MKIVDQWKVKELPTQNPTVFLDTGPLLPVWSRWWQGLPISDPCFVDLPVRRVTSYKCVAEIHNILRGRANKGEGQRAEKVIRFLGKEYEASTVQGLATRLQIKKEEALFRYAQAFNEWPPDANLMSKFVDDSGQKLLQAQWEINQPFRDAVQLHQHLIGKVDEFLHQYTIHVLSANEVFTPQTLGDWHSFVEQSIIRSEDLEIVFAAEVAHASLFITDDEELIEDSLTLGMFGHESSIVTPLSFPNFWRKDQYQIAMTRLAEGGLFKSLDEIKKSKPCE